MADSGCSQGDDDEKQEKGKDPIDEPESDEAYGGDSAAPEDHLPNRNLQEHKTDQRANDTRFELSERERQRDDRTVPSEVAFDREKKSRESLEVGGRHDRVGRDTGHDHVPSVEVTVPPTGGHFPVGRFGQICSPR